MSTIARLVLLGLAFVISPSIAPADGWNSTARAEAQSTSFTLENGMQVIVIPDHRAPIVTHMVWYKVGSADEPPGKSGIAHFFEHLLFKGTTANPAGTFDAEIAAVGGKQNAFTSYDFTAFFQVVPPSALQRMMELEADRMRNLILTDDVVATEREVVLEERRSNIEADPSGLLSEEVRATLFQNHPYRLPIIGWAHEIAALNRTDAVAFYDRYYRPNNAVLVVAGDVTPDGIRRMADETYGRLQRGEEIPPRVRPSEPPADARRAVTLSDDRVATPSFGKQWVVPSYHTAKPGEAEALDLLAEILGGGTRSRFYQALVVNGDLAASVGASFDGSSLDATTFSIYGSPSDPDRLADLENGVAAEIGRLIRDGVPDDELDRAKRRFVRGMVFARDDASGMASMYGQAVTTGSTVADVEEWTRRLEAVTPQQVQAAARAYLRPDIEVAGYLLPRPESAQPESAR